MPKKVTGTGKAARRIEASGKPQRRIGPEEFATALGAELLGDAGTTEFDPTLLAALGGQLVKRLRSSGGRPALVGATETCRVPLSAEDVRALEAMGVQISASSGPKTSVGQLVSVIVRAHLQALNTPAGSKQRGASPPVSAGSRTAGGSEAGSTVPTDWRTSFPNVRDIELVADCAQRVADAQMPLMIPRAA